MRIRKVENPKDKQLHHMVTLLSFGLSMCIFATMKVARFDGIAVAYIALTSVILLGRAILTEVGIRRRT